MGSRWFRLDDYYENVGETCVFYPSTYSRGYRFSPEDQASMNGVLGPFLNHRLWIEFIAIFCFVTFSLTVVAAAFLLSASTEELDKVLAIPPWVWLAGAVALSGLILSPVIYRLRSTIRRQLDQMGVEASEPPRPDFFIVDGAFSLKRLTYALLVLGMILAMIGSIVSA